MTNAYVDLKLVEEKVFKDPIHRYIHVGRSIDMGFN